MIPVNEKHEMRTHAALRWSVGGVQWPGQNDWLERISLRRSSAARLGGTQKRRQSASALRTREALVNLWEKWSGDIGALPV